MLFELLLTATEGLEKEEKEEEEEVGGWVSRWVE